MNLRLAAVTMYLAISGAPLFAGNPDTATRSSGPAITAVAGESWLNHLHRSFGDTSMGKTGRLGPPASETGEPSPALVSSSTQSVRLTGKDLYRLNCQGCHGEAGLGAPPEIHSVIDPVRATSASLVRERMKERGFGVDSATASQMARQAQVALVDRLHKGGQDMPVFSQLDEAEVGALLEYLKQLSGVPGGKQLTVTEPALRVGELIAKSTCHVCHDATGTNPTPEQLESGAIPPLETLTARTDESQFIRKVTQGAPIVMGTPATPHRGRMPVFFYLSSEEAADVYLYLTSDPPSPREANTAAVAATTHDREDNDPPAGGPALPVDPPTAAALPDQPPARALPDWVLALSMVGVGVLVMMLLVGGFCFAAYELRRLGRDGERRQLRSILVLPPNVSFGDRWRSERSFSLRRLNISERKGDVSYLHGCVK